MTMVPPVKRIFDREKKILVFFEKDKNKDDVYEYRISRNIRKRSIEIRWETNGSGEEQEVSGE